MSRQSEIDRIVKIMKITESSAADFVDNGIRSKDGFETENDFSNTVRPIVYKEDR